MRILLTGSNGYIGGALARRLAARGDVELLAQDRAVDLVDARLVRRMLAAFAPDAVVHAAGRTSGPPSLMLRDNALASATLAEAMVAAAPGAGLILLGSAAQYGPGHDQRPRREDDLCLPTDPYAISKQAGEVCAMFRGGGRVTSLRIFNVVAPEPGGGQVFAGFLGKAAEALGGPSPRRVRMGPLEAVRDFIDIEDVGRAVEAVINRGAWGEVINLASGEGRTVRALIEQTLGLIGGGLTLDATAARGEEISWSVGDPAKCRALLGFAPSNDLTLVLTKAAAWVRSAAKAGVDARSHA